MNSQGQAPIVAPNIEVPTLASGKGQVAMVGNDGKYGASSYASRLTPRQEKGGGLGNPERHDDEFVGASKIMKLVELIRNAKKCVVLTGAGISTSAGVSDFRGPNGVWTAEKKGVPPPASKSFDTANPTLTHMALVGLAKSGHVSLVISQNVDGLHLRSGLPRTHLAELHGNLFMETCEVCGMEYLRDFDVGGISCRRTGRVCERAGCGGALRDNLLDWEDALPEREYIASEAALQECDLCICMGTSLRIRPASELPLHTVRRGGKLVIINLQSTPKDRHAHLKIQLPVDQVMRGVMALLREPIPSYRRHIELCKSIKFLPPPRQELQNDGGDDDDEESAVEVFSGSGRSEAMPLVRSATFFFDFFDGPEQPVPAAGPPFRCALPRGLRGAHAVLDLVDGCSSKEVVLELRVKDEEEGQEVLEREEVLVTEILYPPDDREEEDRIVKLAQQAPNRTTAQKRKAPSAAASEAQGNEGQRRGKDWRQCATCSKWGRSPAGLATSQPWYCRRRCQPLQDAGGQPRSQDGDTNDGGDAAADATEQQQR